MYDTDAQTAGQSEAWLEANLRFRLGRFFTRPIVVEIDGLDRSFLSEARHLYAINGKGRNFYNLNSINSSVSQIDGRWVKTTPGYPWAIYRTCAFVNYFAQTGCSADILVNLQDAQNCNYKELLCTSLTPAVLQFSRICGRDDIILFPLIDYMEIGGRNVPDTLLHGVSWEAKRASIVWRGSLSGNRLINETNLRVEDRVYKIFNNDKLELLEGSAQFEDIMTLCNKYPRFRTVVLAASEKWIDAAFSGLDNELAQSASFCEIVSPYVGKSLSVREQLSYRYILCLEGNDYPSSLFWALCSNSLVLMPPSSWETVFHANLLPDVHYLQVSADLTDLEERFAWCESNPVRVQEIITAANFHMKPFLDRKLRALLDTLTIETYCRNFSTAGQRMGIFFGNLSDRGSTWKLD